MSVEAYKAALEAELQLGDEKNVQPATAKAVLLGLANHAGPTGDNCYPSVKRLSVYTGLGESTVRRYMGLLRTIKVLEVIEESGRRTPTVYRLNLPLLTSWRHPWLDDREHPPSVGSHPETSQPDRPGVETSQPERVTSRPEHETSQSEQETSQPEQGDLSYMRGEPYLEPSTPNRQRTINEQQQSAAAVVTVLLKLGYKGEPVPRVARWAVQGFAAGHINNPVGWARRAIDDDYPEPDWYQPTAEEQRARIHEQLERRMGAT